jgi:hypothetical protein
MTTIRKNIQLSILSITFKMASSDIRKKEYNDLSKLKKKLQDAYKLCLNNNHILYMNDSSEKILQ